MRASRWAMCNFSAASLTAAASQIAKQELGNEPVRGRARRTTRMGAGKPVEGLSRAGAAQTCPRRGSLLAAVGEVKGACTNGSAVHAAI